MPMLLSSPFLNSLKFITEKSTDIYKYFFKKCQSLKLKKVTSIKKKFYVLARHNADKRTVAIF